MNDANNLDSLKLREEQLKARKGELSRLIGEAKKNGSDASELITEMGAVSAEFKEVTGQIKALKKSQRQQAGQSREMLSDDPLDKSKQAEKLQQIVEEAYSASQILSHAAKAFRVVDIDAEQGLRTSWDEYVDRHPQASPYHKLWVKSFVESVYGHPCRFICALDESDRVVGVLPLTQLNSRLFGNFIVSVPYFNYGGILADSKQVAQMLIADAVRWRDQVGAGHIELRHLTSSNLGLPQRTEKLTFWLALPEQEEDLWLSFKPKVRAQIKRPQKEVAEITIGGAELLSDFYAVFARNMRDLGTPVYGRNFFHGFLSSYGESARVVIGRLNGSVVACAIIIGSGDRMEIPWASTVQEANSSGINMLMYWEILRFSIKGKYKIFDFGRCTEDSGTYKFKQQWGATPVRLHWDYCLAEGKEAPKLNPDNPKFKLLIAVWTRLPVWLTNMVGPMVVKYLP
ncbi:FemAB family PEP-CTERM system-associated protein [Hahella sp. KA22]|uniref:FemAB family XrtA/PEP-CTERM system-associated protein n=1 Tax=Hahella sp. KA22 TaxID=1628392 RepID=UPI000FDF5C98|nr:FemAB family XrtA/PEP-CTERM system-associated protein [Hahella sp. KA22]AZZ93001.1 FemAB family PEP-CTERM system-associated protein [Hahella sp. KA22]QAY56375.1 FemAB family PEP-CTERM system-associated protein [Hahella sp. KA22]